jgi:hypothetical protein
MKNNRSPFTPLLCIALITVIALAELLYCFHSTLKSPNHFAAMLDNDKNLSKLTLLVYNGLSAPIESNTSQAAINRYAVSILNKIDQTWVKGQIYIGTTGLHRYISSEATTLPTFDLAPIKAVIKESLISDIMKQPQTEGNINNVKTVLTVLNNKYFSAIINFGLNNQLASMLLELAPIRNTGFDRTTILEIIRIYLSFSNKDTTLEQASYSIVKQMALEALELDKLRDYFDSNLFLEKAFGEVNPIASFKTLVYKVDTSISLSTKVLFWCFLLLLFIKVEFSLAKLLRITFYCTFVASAFNLLLSALLINPAFSSKLIAQFADSQGAFGKFLIKLLVFLFRDFGLYLALQSVVVGIIAAVLYLIIKLVFRKENNGEVIIPFAAWRFTAVILIFILIFAWWNMTAINRATRTFRSDMDKLHSTDINQSIKNGLIEAGGMDFLKYLQKK